VVRLAIWYESGLGRNDGNPLYTTAFLKRVQYFCDVIQKNHLNEKLLLYFPTQPPKDERAEAFAKWFMDTYNQPLQIEHIRPYNKDLHIFGDFDLHLWVDWGEDGLTGVLPYEPLLNPGKPLVYWASDTHIGYDYRLGFARRADLAFCAHL